MNYKQSFKNIRIYKAEGVPHNVYNIYEKLTEGKYQKVENFEAWSTSMGPREMTQWGAALAHRSDDPSLISGSNKMARKERLLQTAL